MSAETANPFTLSSHVLDQVAGGAAGGMVVHLSKVGDDSFAVCTAATNDDGRVTHDDWRLEGELEEGIYKLTFETLKWSEELGRTCFYPTVDINFRISRELKGTHYHVPLLLSAFGYSTYRENDPGLLNDDTLPRFISPSLEKLNLSRSLAVSLATAFNDCGPNTELSNLTEVQVGDRANISIKALHKVLSHAPNLVKFDGNEYPDLRDTTVKTLAKKCKKLEYLSLRFCSKVTAASVTQLLHSCQNLVHIDLSRTKINSSALLELCLIVSPHLLSFKASGMRGNNSKVVRCLAERCGGLQALHLSHCLLKTKTLERALGYWRQSLTDLNLDFVAEQPGLSIATLVDLCPRLTALSIAGWSLRGSPPLLNVLPNLKTLNIEYTTHYSTLAFLYDPGFVWVSSDGNGGDGNGGDGNGGDAAGGVRDRDGARIGGTDAVAGLWAARSTDNGTPASSASTATVPSVATTATTTTTTSTDTTTTKTTDTATGQANCAPLVELNVSRQIFRDRDYFWIAHSPLRTSLTSLSVNHTRRSRTGGTGDIAVLAHHLPQLRKIELVGTDVSEDEVAALVKYCPHIRSLDLSSCRVIPLSVRRTLFDDLVAAATAATATVGVTASGAVSNLHSINGDSGGKGKAPVSGDDSDVEERSVDGRDDVKRAREGVVGDGECLLCVEFENDRNN